MIILKSSAKCRSWGQAGGLVFFIEGRNDGLAAIPSSQLVWVPLEAEFVSSEVHRLERNVEFGNVAACSTVWFKLNLFLESRITVGHI